MNNRRLSTRKTIQVLVILTILVWATQTLLHQWGFGGRDHVLLAGIFAGNATPALPSQEFVQGSLENTGNSLDVAIQGDGFFRVKGLSSLGDGIVYTRNGELFVNNVNQLVVGMGSGFEVLPPITIPTGVTHIQISQDGFITGIKPGSKSPSELGQMRLMRFANPAGLRKVRNLVYEPTAESGPPMEVKFDQPDAPQLMQDFLESNARP